MAGPAGTLWSPYDGLQSLQPTGPGRRVGWGFATLSAKPPGSMALTDSSIIRAHQHAAGAKRGRRLRHRPFSWRTKHQNQRRRRRERPAGPLAADSRAGPRLRAAPQLLAGLKCRHVVADRGYAADALLEFIRAAGAKPYIPSTGQRLVRRSVDRRIYRQRNLVERFFCKTQALPTRRHSLRQARQELPRQTSPWLPLASGCALMSPRPSPAGP